MYRSRWRVRRRVDGNSPKLLQLSSGVGAAALLQIPGVPVLHDQPGVGANPRDHYTLRMTARATSAP